jgi:hypothetical protein
MRLACVLVCSLAACSVNVVAPCADGVLDGDESDIDCGGSCGKCANGKRCDFAFDCASGVCGANGVCGGTPGLPSSAGAQTYHIDPGASLIVSPGSQAGYGILANVGGSFRIVWTGDGAQTGTFSSFVGTVWTTSVMDTLTTGCGGQCTFSGADTISGPTQVQGGYRADFSSAASVGLHGFDFTVTMDSLTQPVYFDLLIDGARRKELIFFSSAGVAATTATVPFGLTTQ